MLLNDIMKFHLVYCSFRDTISLTIKVKFYQNGLSGLLYLPRNVIAVTIGSCCIV